MVARFAREAGFTKRKPRKISAANLLGSVLTECAVGSPSYNDLASRLDDTDHSAPSRQAVGLRINEDFHKFVESLLGHVIGMKVHEDGTAGILSPERFRGYRRVLVQDSTVIKLPGWLFAKFSGVSNATTSVCNARIQAVFDLLAGRLVSFSIDPYSKNDLAAAPELEIREGDLVLRDRGYLTVSEIQRHCDRAADFIYRHKTGTVYLGVKTQLPLDLPGLLKRHGSLDMEVLINNPERTCVRLVAQPVDEETANTRRMRAKKENKGHNPSKAVLGLMDWTIFLTNIPAAGAAFADILGIYGLRWRIEVIFKAWKSHLKFDTVHRMSETQLLVLLKARLLVIAASTNLYRVLERAVWRFHRRRISLLKLTKYLAREIKRLLRVLSYPEASVEEKSGILPSLARYCSYDKRRKRRNFAEIMDALA